MSHITSCHDCPYHILVHLQVQTQRRDYQNDCIDNVQCAKEKTEQECDLVKYKVKCSKSLLVPDMKMSDGELQNLVTQIEEYQQKMAKAQSPWCAGILQRRQYHQEPPDGPKGSRSNPQEDWGHL